MGTVNKKWLAALLFGVCTLVVLLVPSSHVTYHARTDSTQESFFPETALFPVEALYEPRKAQFSSVYPVFEFVNESNQLKSTIRKEGWQIKPVGRETFDSWTFSYSPTHIGRRKLVRLTEPLPEDIAIKENTLVTITRPELVEWYKNSPDGIEQGFTITAPPKGRGLIALVGNIDTELALRENTENHITFSYEGRDVLRIDKFVAFDAYYTPLPITFSYDEDAHTLIMTVDDTDATYPIVIDPLATSPVWSVESNQSGAQLGYSSAVGDVNGDGIADVITGAPVYTNGETNEGALMVYYGSASGPSTTPDQIIESNSANTELGYQIALAGDVNNDGYEDIMVGAPYYSNGEAQEGAVFFFYGSAVGLSTTSPLIIESNSAFERLGSDDGYALSSVGDVNGDGYDDVLIGNTNWYNGVEYVGRADIYEGSASGIVTTPLTSFVGTQDGESFGTASAPAGDINSDGYDDFIVSSFSYDADFIVGPYNTGRIQLYYGGVSGPDTIADWSAVGVQNERIGWTLDTGDFNGDGYIDIVAGSGADDEIEVFYGSLSGFPSEPDWQHYDYNISDRNSGWFDVGDANNDGYDDILVGSGDYYNESFNVPGFGSAFLYQGSPRGLSGVADWNDKPDPGNSRFGWTVSLGDVNDDGFDDAIIGAPFYVNGETNEGRLYLYLGNSTALYGSGNTDIYNPKPHQIIAGPPNGSFSFSESMASGDFNGDGQRDVVSGTGNENNSFGGRGAAYAYYGLGGGDFPDVPNITMTSGDGFTGYFAGSGRLTAGDINNDGYDDIIAVDTSYHPGTFSGNGGVFLFYGSVSGLPAVPDWSYIGGTSDRIGEAVTTADVNNDNFSDIIVSSGFSTPQVILAFHGSASGPSTTPNWSYDVSTEQGVEMLSSAGDVNNDGYEDVLAAAPYYTNGENSEGRLLLFYGSSTGLGITPDWSFEPNIVDVNIGSKYSGQGWGSPLGSAGDFNNDGYSDFAVGAMAYLYNLSSWGDGATYVFYGSATGPGVNEDVLLTQVASGPNQLFGNAVTSPGDMNNDGYDDLVVGAPEMDEGIASNSYGGGQLYEGRVYMYYGSATGIDTTPSWSAETNTSETWMGQSAVALGDVNDDGYADFAAGSVWQVPYYSGDTDGAIYVYFSQGGFTVTESGGSTLLTEPAGTDTFDVVLTSQPVTDVVFDILSQDVGAATVSTTTLTFTNGNWNTPQTVIVSPVPDGDANDERVPIRISINRAASDGAFKDLPAQHVLALVTDDGLGGPVPPTVISDDWVPVGPPRFSADYAQYTSLAFNSSDVPYVAYQDGADADKATVRRFNGATWEVVGTAGFSPADAYHTSLAFDSNDVPYVAYVDWSGTSTGATVERFNGASWEVVGNRSFSDGDALWTSLIFDSNDVPYVSYSDRANGNRATVQRFNGVSWEVVGTTGFSVGGVFLSIAINSNDVPYVAYDDDADSYKVTVQRFNGASWEVVGANGFTGSNSTDSKIAFDSNDVPYVAYQDGGNGSKATVQRFNGASWEVVGSAGFSTGTESDISLVIDSNDVPYVSYGDYGNGGKATVMRFNGTNWVAFGTNGFSDEGVYWTSLKLNSNNIPYIAYWDRAEGNSGKATVMGFVRAATSITQTTATLNGAITATGGENPSVRGFHYGLTAGYGSTVSAAGSFGVGTFALPISGLTCNTTYHFDAYATNSAGIGDTGDLTFVTSACSGTPTSTPTTTPSSSGGSSSGSKIATSTPTASSTPLAPPVVSPYVPPPVIKTTSPSPSKPKPSAGTTDIDRSELTIPSQIVTAPEVKPPITPPRAVVEEEIVREPLPPTENVVKRVLAASVEKIRQVFNSVRDTPWAEIITAVGLVSLILRPLFTSLRIQSVRDAVLVIRRLFSLLLPRRRRIVEPWGTIYDAQTKRPLDPAYVALIALDSGEEVTSAVTDLEGRYGFLVKPGRYRVEPQKTHYAFPSRELYRNQNDYVYDNLYFGEELVVDGENTVLRRNIPMDAQGRDWNEEEKVRMGIVSSRKKRQIMIILLNTFFVVGALYSFYVIWVSPNLWNIVTTVLYVVIWTAQMLWKREFHLTTVVRRNSGGVVPFALIKVYHPDQSIVIKQVVADMNGKFYFLVAAGRYRVTVEEKDAQGEYHVVHTINTIDLPRGIFLKDIVLPTR